MGIIIAVIIVFFIAGMVKGIIGLGLPTIAMGLLTAFYPPAMAASLLLIPSTITNVWQLCLGTPVWPLFKRLWPMLAGIVAGTLFSFLPPLSSNSAWVHAGLGLILCLYGLWGLLGRKLPSSQRHERWLSPCIGYLTGTITAATGVFVLPAVPYLQTLSLSKDELIQALGLSFTVSTLALAAQLLWHTGLPNMNVGLSAFAIVPAIIGMYAGQHIRQFISETVFKRCFFTGLMLLGAYMLLKDAVF